MYSIEIKNLTKIYRKGFWGIKVPAVVDVSFNVHSGCVTGFVGPNGAGKTTTIKTIMGLVRPQAGDVRVHGCSIADYRARNSVAYLSEQPYFYGHLTSRESLEFASHLLNLDKKKIGVEVERVLDLVELSHKSKSKIKEMSKGMQQRLNMAQALVGTPKLLILDEPMSGMDPPGRRLFRSLFKDLAKSGITIFFSTHVLEDIESVCDRVIVLSKGEKTYDGAVKELLDKGFKGTEIELEQNPSSLAERILKAGCTIDQQSERSWVITAPPGVDSVIVLEMLSNNKLYPSRIERRKSSMEELLYSGGGAQ
jgi:ABC-2 type transport system ATP-binding protein